MDVTRRKSLRIRLGLILWVAVVAAGISVSLCFHDVASANASAEYQRKNDVLSRVILSSLAQVESQNPSSASGEILSEHANRIAVESGSGLSIKIVAAPDNHFSSRSLMLSRPAVQPLSPQSRFGAQISFGTAELNSQLNNIRWVAELCILSVAIFGALVALWLATYLVNSDRSTRALRFIAVGWRAGLLEIFLAAVCAGVAFMGFLSFESQRTLMEDLPKIAGMAPISRGWVPWSAQAISHRLEVALLLSAALSIASLIVMRVAMTQQTELQLSKTENLNQQSAFGQISANLPIGFFTYSGGAIRQTNSVINRFAGTEPLMLESNALEAILVADDRLRVMSALQGAENTRESFTISFRISDVTGRVRSVESRGVPVYDVDGNFDHMIGFLLDVTDSVEAHQDLTTANERLSGAVAELEVNFEATVHSLVKVVEAKDPYTAGHSSRVTAYSMRIGRALGLDPSELHTLEMGTLIHDIGKIGIPDAVLTKPSGLTNQEFSLIRQHPTIGARMVEDIPAFEACLPIVLLHHERLDGTGYPYGLSGDAIPLLVRIAAVADCFDALTSDRSYRRARTQQDALDELRKSASEGALDPEIVAILAETVERDGLLWIPLDSKAA